MKNLFCYTDVASGDSFARTGVAKPRPGTGDGGIRGAGGEQGVREKRHKQMKAARLKPIGKSIDIRVLAAPARLVRLAA